MVNRLLATSDNPIIMGILNVTPDSFADGGRYTHVEKALEHAFAMIDAGADMIDIGGESTRPGAAYVDEAEEASRVIPVIKAIKAEAAIPVSIDTNKPAVMQQALDAGIDMINDVCALTKPGALEIARRAQVPICLMHMQGEPQTMQHSPVYNNVLDEVKIFLQQRVAVCLEAGIDADRIILDPGFGFGKKLAHNLTLLNDLPSIVGLGFPLLVGLSRKSMIGQLLDLPVEERVYGSIAAAVIAVMHGAKIIRVHDVKPTVQALRIVSATRGATKE